MKKLLEELNIEELTTDCVRYWDDKNSEQPGSEQN
jgi:hypothetical protein